MIISTIPFTLGQVIGDFTNQGLYAFFFSGATHVASWVDWNGDTLFYVDKLEHGQPGVDSLWGIVCPQSKLQVRGDGKRVIFPDNWYPAPRPPKGG